MKDKIEQAKAQLRGHVEPTRARLSELLRELDVPLREMERVSVDYELCNDKDYQMMASLYCDIQNALDKLEEDTAGQKKMVARESQEKIAERLNSARKAVVLKNN